MQINRSDLLLKLQIASATYMHYRWRYGNGIYTWRYARHELLFSCQLWNNRQFGPSRVLARVRSFNEVSPVRHLRWAEYWDPDLTVVAERLGVALPDRDPALEAAMPYPDARARRSNYHYGHWSSYAPATGTLYLTRVYLFRAGTNNATYIGRFNHQASNDLRIDLGSQLTWKDDHLNTLPRMFETSIDMIVPVMSAISRAEYDTARMMLVLS